MASSHDWTCTYDLLRGLVAGASPLVCAVFFRDIDIDFLYLGYFTVGEPVRFLFEWVCFTQRVKKNRTSKTNH